MKSCGPDWKVVEIFTAENGHRFRQAELDVLDWINNTFGQGTAEIGRYISRPPPVNRLRQPGLSGVGSSRPHGPTSFGKICRPFEELAFSSATVLRNAPEAGLSSGPSAYSGLKTSSPYQEKLVAYWEH